MFVFSKTIVIDADSFSAQPAFDEEYWQNNHLINFLIDARKDGHRIVILGDDWEYAQTVTENALAMFNAYLNEDLTTEDLYDSITTYTGLDYSVYSKENPPSISPDAPLADDNLAAPAIIITPQPHEEMRMRLDSCGLIIPPVEIDDMDAYERIRENMYEQLAHLADIAQSGFKAAKFQTAHARNEQTFVMGFRDRKDETLSDIFNDPEVKDFLTPQPKTVGLSTGDISEAEFLLKSYFANRIREVRSPHMAQDAHEKNSSIIEIFQKYYGEPAQLALIAMEQRIAQIKVHP